MHILCKTIAVALFGLCGVAANAATFDFQDMANSYKSSNGGHEADFDQMFGYNSGYFTDGGVSITSMTGNAGRHVLFDGDNNNRAGVGVCSSGYKASGQSQCSSSGGSTPGDDNMKGPEIMTIVFDQMVSLASLVVNGTIINGNGHGILTGTDAIIVNGTAYDLVNSLLSAADLLSIGTHSSYTLQAGSGYEVYIKAATVTGVPLPAGAVLLLTGFGGLAFARRRKS